MEEYTHQTISESIGVNQKAMAFHGESWFIFLVFERSNKRLGLMSQRLKGFFVFHTFNVIEQRTSLLMVLLTNNFQLKYITLFLLLQLNLVHSR